MPTQTTSSDRDPAKRLIEWVQSHRRVLIASATVLAVIAVMVWSEIARQQGREADARAALENARAAAQAGNLPLAASDLARLINSYGGTASADEAVIILAQVRLAQNQPLLAVTELRQAIEAGLSDQFQSPAYGLLGTALENTGSPADAGEAYENAANAAWYEYLTAQYLNEAGRAFWTAGDTARAVSAYERVLRDFKDAPGATEAEVRLAELRASGSSAGG